MNTDLEKLLDLQAKDLTLLEVDERLAALLDEIAALDAAAARAAAEKDAVGDHLAAAGRRQRELESRIESYRTLQERRRTRMEQVKNAREAQAIMSEMEMARTVLVREEGEWIKCAEQVQGLEARAAAAESALTELGASQETARADLAARQEELQAERATALAAREESAAAIEKSIRLRYDRLRSNRQGAVVVAVRGVACGACFTAVPMSRRGQIRNGLLVEGCEACGVILYAEELVAG
jgi:predicted  nucleic acid-binding Zn-ribbon protein